MSLILSVHDPSSFLFGIMVITDFLHDGSVAPVVNAVLNKDRKGVSSPGRFDFVLAVGVLYHMLEPLKLLHDIARVTDAFGLWTHYYDRDSMRGKLRFDSQPVIQTVEGKSAKVYKQYYLSSGGTAKFCGGTEPTSCWVTKDGLLQYVKGLGFEVQVGEDNPQHPNGPSILLFARRV